MRIRFAVALSCVFMFVCCVGNDRTFCQLPNQNWTEFRGPHGNGHANARDLPIEFGENENLQWKTAIPGRGWSSPIIIDDQIWLTTAFETAATPEQREKKLANAPQGATAAFGHIRLVAMCVDRESGSIKNTIDLFEIDDPPLINTLNSFASPTPVANGTHVFFHFGTFGTACVERSSGEIVWKNQDYQLDHETGPGSSPILWKGLLIFHCDGCDQQFVVALNAETGKEVWRTARSGKMMDNGSYKKAFSTPVIVQRNNQDQLISTAANWVYGYDPSSGDELWKISYGQLGFSNVARPIFSEDSVFVCSCFMKSKMLSIDISGDQPLDESRVNWTYNRQVPNMPSPIIVDELIYFVSDRGIATCLEAESGQQKWQNRLGGNFSASPLFADGKIWFCNRKGEVFVVNPNAEKLDIAATNQLDSRIMASPAAVDNSMYVRSEKSLYRFEKSN